MKEDCSPPGQEQDMLSRNNLLTGLCLTIGRRPRIARLRMLFAQHLLGQPEYLSFRQYARNGEMSHPAVI